MSGVRPDVTGSSGAGRGAQQEPPGQGPPGPPEEEPDYRFTLANERTFLAWFRTALALIAGGVAVVQLLPPLAFTGARHVLGVLLSVTGAALALVAVLRWRRVQAAMRRGEALPATRLPLVLGLGLAALTAYLLVLVLLSGRAA